MAFLMDEGLLSKALEENLRKDFDLQKELIIKKYVDSLDLEELKETLITAIAKCCIDFETFTNRSYLGDSVEFNVVLKDGRQSNG